MKYGGATRLLQELPDAHLIVDTEMRGTAWGHFTALKWGFESGAEWVIACEEDAILCTDFPKKAKIRCVEAQRKGYSVIQFCRTVRQRKDTKDGRWVVYPNSMFITGVGNGYHFSFLRSYVSEVLSDFEGYTGLFGDGPRTEAWTSESIVRLVLRKYGYRGFLETYPNLIQHDTKMPSSMGTVATSRMTRTSWIYDQEGS